jgi:hypothetical protein
VRTPKIRPACELATFPNHSESIAWWYFLYGFLRFCKRKLENNKFINKNNALVILPLITACILLLVIQEDKTMSIQGIGSYNPASYQPPASGADSAGVTTPDTAAQDFLNYMKESPAERMVDAWLKAHGLTKQSLAALPPDKQNALMKEMAKDIADEIKQKAESKQKGVTTDVSA